MEKFLRFKEDVDIKELQQSVSDPRIVVLRKSQTTDTIQIRVPEGMSNKEIKKVFGNYEIKKVYNEFPYPISSERFSKFLIWPIIKVFNRNI